MLSLNLFEKNSGIVIALQVCEYFLILFETISQLMTAYRKADEPKTYEFCLQFDESTAQKMLGQLKIEYERAKEKSTETELKEFFRQDFIDADSEKRKKEELMANQSLAYFFFFILSQYAFAACSFLFSPYS